MHNPEWFTFEELRAFRLAWVTDSLLRQLAARFDGLPESKARARKAITPAGMPPIFGPLVVEFHISTLPPPLQAQIRAKFAPTHIAERIKRLGIWRSVSEPTAPPQSDVSQEEVDALVARLRNQIKARKA